MSDPKFIQIEYNTLSDSVKNRLQEIANKNQHQQSPILIGDFAKIEGAGDVIVSVKLADSATGETNTVQSVSIGKVPVYELTGGGKSGGGKRQPTRKSRVNPNRYSKGSRRQTKRRHRRVDK